MVNNIRVGFGNANFSTMGGSLACYLVDKGFVRTFLSKKYKPSGITQHPAAEGSTIAGSLFLQSISDIPDGTVVLLQGNRTWRGALHGQGSIFLRLRESGPLLLVRYRPPTDVKSVLGQYVVAFEGRADLLTVDDLQHEGKLPHAGYRKAYLDPEEIGELFDVLEVQPEVQARPELVVLGTIDGEEQIALVAPAARRRIRIK